jgi:hypothetical protein
MNTSPREQLRIASTLSRNNVALPKAHGILSTQSIGDGIMPFQTWTFQHARPFHRQIEVQHTACNILSGHHVEVMECNWVCKWNLSKALGTIHPRKPTSCGPLKSLGRFFRFQRYEGFRCHWFFEFRCLRPTPAILHGLHWDLETAKVGECRQVYQVSLWIMQKVYIGEQGTWSHTSPLFKLYQTLHGSRSFINYNTCIINQLYNNTVQSITFWIATPLSSCRRNISYV